MDLRVGSDASQRRRVAFVDLLRAMAAFQMVQGHTIDAVLAPQFRQGVFFDAWRYSRGLTSVAFLFVAGFAFEYATLRRFQKHREDRSAVLGRFQRAGILIGLGYLLHFPTPLFFAGDHGTRLQALGGFWAADILQCIGITLLFMESLVVLANRPGRIVLVCAVLAATLFMISPRSNAIEVSGAWTPFLNLLSPNGGSVYPLVPWAGHILLGVVVGHLVRMSPGSPTGTARLFGIALGLLAASYFLDGFGCPRPLPGHLSKSGWVVLACGVLAYSVRFVAELPRWITVVAGETLAIYLFHILLVYGYGLGLAFVIGKILPPLAAVSTAVAVMIGSYVFVLYYRGRLRKGFVESAVPSR